MFRPVCPAAVTGTTSQHKHWENSSEHSDSGSHKIRFRESAGACGALTKQSHVDKTHRQGRARAQARQQQHLTFTPQGGISSLISPKSPLLICSLLELDEDKEGTTKPALLIFLLVISVHIIIPTVRPVQAQTHSDTHPLPPLSLAGWVPPSCSPARPDCA